MNASPIPAVMNDSRIKYSRGSPPSATSPTARPIVNSTNPARKSMRRQRTMPTSASSSGGILVARRAGNSATWNWWCRTK